MRTAGVICVLLLWAAPALSATIAWSPADPVEGQPATVTLTEGDLPLAGASVRAVYQPGSEVARTEEIGLTDDAGTLAWTPVRAGVVRLQAEVTTPDTTFVVSRNLSVRFHRVPWMGLLVMAAAGLVLYGGVVRGFRLLGAPPAHLPPDT